MNKGSKAMSKDAKVLSKSAQSVQNALTERGVAFEVVELSSILRAQYSEGSQIDHIRAILRRSFTVFSDNVYAV